MQSQEPAHALMNHIFRHESGKMVSVLIRVFGICHLDLVEDIVQETMCMTLSVWKLRSIPQNPSTHALLSLMCFVASRFDARIDDQGLIVLLPDQDRKLWNQDLIKQGLHYLSKSVQGSTITRFHLESAIASCYATTPDFSRLNWPHVYKLYTALLTIHPTPIILLNRAIVQAKVSGVAWA